MSRVTRSAGRGRRGAFAAVALTAIAVSAGEARAQDRLWTALGDKDYSEFGEYVWNVGDLNGDGRPEIAVMIFMSSAGDRIVDGATGTPIVDVPRRVPLYHFADVNGDGVDDLFLLDGVVGTSPTPCEVLSGKTQKSLYTYLGYGGTDVGDVDGDGVHDFVAYYGTGWPNPSELRLFSGKNGAVLLKSSPTGGSSDFGFYSQPAGDWNGDGVMDVVTSDLPSPYGLGTLVVVSLKDGSVLATGGPASNTSYLTAYPIEKGADYDQDGVDDFLVSNGYETVGGQLFAGKAWLFSGATLNEIASFSGSASYDFLQVAAAYGDVDGDGVADFALQKNPYAAAPIDVFSGRTQRRLYRIQSNLWFDALSTATGATDLDGDGLADMVVGRPYADGKPGTIRAGAATAERGRTAFLVPDPPIRTRPPAKGSWQPLADRTFFFHLTDFMPGSTVSVYHVETDGVALSPKILIGARKADVHGEAEFGAAFDPANSWFGVHAVGTDHLGRSVTTAIERFGYR